jgi:hypothetical protein
MSTRKAKDNSIFHQHRYASSPEFERGLLANLVAKRCALLNDPRQRELLWFIQYMSHRDGGMTALTKAIIAKYPDRIQSLEMTQMNLKRGKMYPGRFVQKLRDGTPNNSQFSAEGLLDDIAPDSNRWEKSPALEACKGDVFFDKCLDAAWSGLEKWLTELCLNPETSLECGPWYFPTLIETLHGDLNSLAQMENASDVVTSLGQKVCDALDYTAYGRGLTLMEGMARTGKSHAARTWCERHPGRARFIEVPPGNDETAFFHALARGLGLGNFLSYKTTQIREKVESVILTANLMLVLDEAQRLWPQMNLRYGFPYRIVWIMKWANAGVPIAMVSTPQFIQTQKAVEKCGWNSAQLTGRISHYELLPAELTAEDLIAVAKSFLPEIEAQVLRKLAIYARSSARYLAAIHSISNRARYLAMKAGRNAATADDVRRAMQESVIPADTKLQSALAAGKTTRAIAAAPTMRPDEDFDVARGIVSDAPSGRAVASPTQFADAGTTAPQRSIKPLLTEA